jgi:hypothetical protein
MSSQSLWLGCVVALAAVVAGEVRGQSPTSVGKKAQRYALLIGVNDYSPPLGKLEYCQRDMTDLRAHLEAAGFAKGNITFMNDQATDSRKRPSKANIEGELRLRLQLANPDDIVLVAFSGHGLQIDGQSYLCPSDARLDANSSLIAINDLYAQLEKCQASQKVLIVDACRNEPIVRGFKSGKLADDLAMQVHAPPKGLIVLSSCEAGQFSAEDPKLKHGVFMHYLMQGLKGAADVDSEIGGNSNGRISLDELYFYAHEKTKRHVAESHGIVQRPVLKGEIIGRFDVALVPAADRVIKPSAGDLATGGFSAADSRLSAGSNHRLLKQGDASLAASDRDGAIAAYTLLLADTSIDDEVRSEALQKRGAAYVARSASGDLTKALTDHLAAGLPGMTLTVRAAAANLQSGPTVIGTLQKNQSVLVTKIENGWLWVEKVDGGNRTQGYLQPAAVLAQPVVTQQYVQTQQYDQYSQDYDNTRSTNSRVNRNGRPPSIWETPEWESPRQIREGRKNGTLR